MRTSATWPTIIPTRTLLSRYPAAIHHLASGSLPSSASGVTDYEAQLAGSTLIQPWDLWRQPGSKGDLPQKGLTHSKVNVFIIYHQRTKMST